MILSKILLVAEGVAISPQVFVGVKPKALIEQVCRLTGKCFFIFAAKAKNTGDDTSDESVGRRRKEELLRYVRQSERT